MDFTFKRIKTAFDKGVSRTQSALGIERDPELRNYKALREEDFTNIAQEFGLERTAQYIEEMERKRLGGSYGRR